MSTSSVCQDSPWRPGKLGRAHRLRNNTSSVLRVTQLPCRPQPGDRIAFRHKLLSDKAGITGRRDRPHDRRIVELLLIVQLVSTRITSRVVMSKALVMLADRADNIALHDLHMVDVIEQLH